MTIARMSKFGAMGLIEKSSEEIAQMIGVIEEVAFKTNLLALNVRVKAARIADAVKGFTVVANAMHAPAKLPLPKIASPPSAAVFDGNLALNQQPNDRLDDPDWSEL